LKVPKEAMSMSTRFNLVMISMLTLGVAASSAGCAGNAQVETKAQTPAPPPPAPPPPPPPAPPAPVAAAAPPPAPAPAPPAKPKAKVEGTRVTIPGELEFDFDKATIKETAGSHDILTTLVEFLNENPSVTKLRVEGHTDNSGSAEHNLKLSQERADAVAAWLTSHGVPATRLTTKGFGQTKPLVANDTDEHKAMNRRTVFHVAEMDGKPVTTTETKTTTTTTTPTTLKH
jgi:outer membrane protein OmpA-like peptidoglycan-associated protein